MAGCFCPASSPLCFSLPNAQPVVETITRNVLDRFLNPEPLDWDQTPPLGEGPRPPLPREAGAAKL